jgi:hypothetical protein
MRSVNKAYDPSCQVQNPWSSTPRHCPLWVSVSLQTRYLKRHFSLPAPWMMIVYSVSDLQLPAGSCLAATYPLCEGFPWQCGKLLVCWMLKRDGGELLETLYWSAECCRRRVGEGHFLRIYWVLLETNCLHSYYAHSSTIDAQYYTASIYYSLHTDTIAIQSTYWHHRYTVHILTPSLYSPHTDTIAIQSTYDTIAIQSTYWQHHYTVHILTPSLYSPHTDTIAIQST